MKSPDVIVAGLGPAGRAVAHRCSAAGLHVLAIDPHPHRRWIPTYAAWRDELPDWLRNDAIATSVSRPAVWTTHQHVLDREYVVLDTDALQDELSLGGASVVQDRVASASKHGVTLASGATVKAALVIDARGAARDHSGPEQTAFGVVVDRATATKALGGQGAWFMDWWTDNGAAADEPPSFLYAVPLTEGRVLLEETCLVGRPALDLRRLHGRLKTRLGRRGILLDGTEPIERVRFPVLSGVPRAYGNNPLAFGSRGALMHPGTGYSVATSLRLADDVALAASSGRHPQLWGPQARAVHALRLAGLRTLLSLKPGQVRPFFASFFALPVDVQRAYLSERDDLKGMVRAMSLVFADLPMSHRRVIMAATVKATRDA